MKTLLVSISIIGLLTANEWAIGQDVQEQQPSQRTTEQSTEAASALTSEKWFLKASKRIEKDGGTIDLQVGAPVTVLQDKGKTFRVSWEGTEFEVEKKALTNDSVVAERIAKNAQARKEDLARLDKFVQSLQDDPAPLPKSNHPSTDELLIRALTGNATAADEQAARAIARPQVVVAPAPRQSRWSNTDRVVRNEPGSRQQPSADYQAKEKARQESYVQRRAETADLKRLEAQRDNDIKHNKTDLNLINEINAKRELLNSKGGEW